MSLIKKLILLLVFFLILNIFSIYGFDYKGYLSKNETLSLNSSADEKDFLDKIEEFKNKLFDSFEQEEELKNFNLVLIKKDGIIEMSGLFGNENDAKKISEVLNINRQGEYIFDENRVIDEYLLDDLLLLITPFKDLFADDSKILVIDKEVTLSGELKDSNHKDLLDSILSKVKIDLKTDITIAESTELSVINNEIIDIEKEAITQPVLNNQDEKIPSNTASNKNDVQLSINNLLLTKKINFERRSTKITEDSNLVVEEIAKILKDNPTFKIEVAGHTDSRGSDSLNKQISQDRASSVREVLISLGVKEDSVTAVGYGEEFPIAKDDENGLSQINRRVEFNILGE